MEWGSKLFTALLPVTICGLLTPALQADERASASQAAERAASKGPSLPLKTVADIGLPGPTNRFDYQSYDPRARLLFIAHLGASTVVVFNAETQKFVSEIPNISQVHGVLAVPELGRVYASATGTNEIVVIDEQTLKEIARVPGGVYPDGIAYAQDEHKLYVSDESGRTETVIDTQVNKAIATIPLGGEVGNTQYDPVSKHIFVNVQTQNELVEIDPHSDAIVARHSLPGAKENHGLLIESRQRLAIIACQGNNRLLVLDMETMHVIATESVGEGPDVLAFDEAFHLLYVASEGGVVSVFREEGKKLIKLGEALLARNAHSVAVNTQTHHVYFPLQSLNGHPVLRVMEPTVRE